jgi:hypothetical protein
MRNGTTGRSASSPRQGLSCQRRCRARLPLSCQRQSRTDDVPFPSSSSTEHLSTLKASLRTRLDSDSRERERTASLRSRKGSDASSLRSTSGAGTANKLRKRRPSASKVVLDASWQAVGEDVDESLTQSDPLDASFSSTFDKRASLSSTVDSSLLQSSPPPEREVEADRSIDEPREDPSETPAPRTASKPPTLFANYLSFSMRIHYVLSWPLYGFLSALAAIPLVRLFVPRLEDRPSLSQILSLSVEGHPSSPRQKQRALRWDSQDGGETGA